MIDKNVFIYGLSGAGKDTIANYLRDKYGYLKFRIAGTIKQYVFETYGFKTQEEFENAKREIPDVRKAHNIFGKQYDTEGLERSNHEATENRINAICDKTALEFEIKYNMKDYPICVVDVRNKFEAELLLNRGFYGIFLNRRNTEFADSKHKTEQDMFTNGELKSLIENLKESNITIIFNSEHKISLDEFDDIREKLISLNDKVKIPIAVTNGGVQELLLCVKDLINCGFDYDTLEKYDKNRNNG